MDVGSTLRAQPEFLEGVQPGDGAFDVPAVAAQPGSVAGAAAGDVRGDAPLAEQAAVLVVVVAAVGVDTPGPVGGPAAGAADARDGVEQGQQLGDVVAVAA